ncbi:GtrA family protein [Oscillospiraceae bacterium Marseille-Q3528]|jgi:hypothetical protein|nr:GtrA family protein [Oscillospiraceae bacterium Marseille-Q3528]WNV58739.1 GtrA family protein [Oscillospiraceae bacterium NTUH-002-81]
MKKLISQIIKFGFVGFLCFFIDYGIMVFLTEALKINYLISSGCSFSVSVIVNYILSIKFVFDADRDANKVKQFLVFLFFSIGGLIINQIVMWVAVDLLGIFYMISKIGATAIVMVYNFITRKLFIEKKS